MNRNVDGLNFNRPLILQCHLTVDAAGAFFYLCVIISSQPISPTRKDLIQEKA